ncbi:MAG: sortase [Erysipelotrichaceae bacterium]|nr:sortase [Erysipelotrichaceae bacterium]MDD6093807.1 sortase [bacterium]MDY3934221.1 sortase [Bacilli bacterium]
MKWFNLKLQIATGVILLVSGTSVLLSDYVKDKRDVVFSEMNLAISELNKDTLEQIDNNDTEEEKVIDKKEEKKEQYYEEYIGVLEISKINFYKGFYNKNSGLNNVDYNLYVLPESSYPDVVNGNLMIAGHSGNYNNSYFANLYKLNVGDTAKVTYKGKKYTYKITDIYYEKKTGTVRILRDKNKTTLTLITCTKDDEAHQTIYIAELI